MTDEFEIALAFAPRPARKALRALWDYDAMLGRIVATTTAPMIGQMRLTWWHEAATALDAGAVRAEPLLQALDDLVRKGIVRGGDLAALVEGWEVLLETLPLSDAALEDYAVKRGDRLFILSATIAEAAVTNNFGAAWALIDFAEHCSDDSTAMRAHSMAARMSVGDGKTGPKMLRILAFIAQSKAKRPFEQLRQSISRIIMLRAVLP